MEKEEMRRGTKRKEGRMVQPGDEITWKEMIGRDPTEADWMPLLDGGQGKINCIACEPAAKRDRREMDLGRHGKGPVGGTLLGAGQVEGVRAGETMGAGQVEGTMDGISLGAGMVEGLLEGEKLGEGQIGGPSEGQSQGAGPANGAAVGAPEGVRQAKATRRRRRLRQHQRRARELRDQTMEGGHGALENKPPMATTQESKDFRRFSAVERQEEWPGLRPPMLTDGSRVNGENKRQLKRENKARRIEKQLNQEPVSHWTTHGGQFKMPPELEGIDEWEGEMCPSGLALHHPAAATLLGYAVGGCPTNTGKPWTRQQMQEALIGDPTSRLWIRMQSRKWLKR
jgi:hypothetical protein